MAQVHRRTARRDEIAAPSKPADHFGERERARLRGSAGPGFEHRRLHLAIIRLQPPIGTALGDPIAGTLEPADGGLGSAGPERANPNMICRTDRNSNVAFLRATGRGPDRGSRRTA